MNGNEAQAIYDRHQLQVGSVSTAVAEVILELEAEGVFERAQCGDR